MVERGKNLAKQFLLGLGTKWLAAFAVNTDDLLVAGDDAGLYGRDAFRIGEDAFVRDAGGA